MFKFILVCFFFPYLNALEVDFANIFACADENSICIHVPKFQVEESSNTNINCNRSLKILFNPPKEPHPKEQLLNGWLYPFGHIGEFPSTVEDCRRTKL
jgi:hypothetical protein